MKNLPSHARNAGYSLVETMVAVGIFLFLTTAILSSVLSTSKAVTDTRQLTNINEEARLAVERLTRELRQAESVTAATLPPTTGGPVAMTFRVDFNGNGVIDNVAPDPEILTYRYDPTSDNVTLTANDETGTALTRPILAGNVSGFALDFRSSLWQHDVNGDGITDWKELDITDKVGNNNGILDTPELSKIDSVVLTLTVTDGKYNQTYQTQVDLRNMNQN